MKVKKSLVLLLSVFCMTVWTGAPGVVTAGYAAEDADSADLRDEDIIDSSKTGSLTICKYDITAAEAAERYTEGNLKATGQQNRYIEEQLSPFAINGVEFTYLKVGDVEQYTSKGSVKVVYEIPNALRVILGLDAGQAKDMSGQTYTTADGKKKTACGYQNYHISDGAVYHYTSTQIDDALQNILDNDEITAKNKLERYLYAYNGQDTDQDDEETHEYSRSSHGVLKTGSNGTASVKGLDLGLYLIVETKVPDQVTDTVNPWFAAIPFTNTYYNHSNDNTNEYSAEHNADGTNKQDKDGGNWSGGEKWMYDAYFYPKNQTGNPTFDKSVKNADSDQNKAESVYRDTVTASQGDVLDYMLLSRLPHITSAATFLSEYTFTDEMDQGLSYNDDFQVAFYDNREDAEKNNTSKAVEIWKNEIDYQKSTPKSVGQENSANENEEGFLTVYTKNKKDTNGRVLQLTEKGLKRINGSFDDDSGEDNKEEKTQNRGYSDYYIVVFYTVKVKTDRSVTLGDKGNQNNAELIWSRTNNSFYEMLKDRNYVYSYGIDLTKKFSGTNNNHTGDSTDKGDFSRVQFKLYNKTDGYYVAAANAGDGIYNVTGKAEKKEDGFTFIPGVDGNSGRILIRGLEADTYQLTEVSTDDGYSLLKDNIDIVITPTDRDIKASVEGVTGMTAEVADRIIRNYGKYTGYDTKTGKTDTVSKNSDSQGVVNEDEQPVNDTREDGIRDGSGASYKDGEQTGITTYKNEQPNGNTIGDTDLYIGDVHAASATVDGQKTMMRSNEELLHTNEIIAKNAAVVMEVTNTKGFHLPDTGGRGLFLITIGGVAAAALGFCVINKKRKNGTV